MPDAVTHYYFGETVVSSLKPECSESIQDNLFAVTTAGPDIWGSLGFLGGKNRSLSNRIDSTHEEKTGIFLQSLAEAARNSELPASLYSYLAGFICHYCLDKETHPYIIAKTGNYDGNYETLKYRGAHMRLERAIDSYIIRHRYGYTPWKFPFKRKMYTLKAFPENLKEPLDKVYKDVYGWDDTWKTLNKALRDQRKFYFMAKDSTGLLTRILVWFMNRNSKTDLPALTYWHKDLDPKKIDYLNNSLSPWTHPYDVNIVSTDSFEILFEKAKKEAVTMLEALYRYIYRKENLNLQEIIGNFNYETGFDCDDERNHNIPQYESIFLPGADQIRAAQFIDTFYPAIDGVVNTVNAYASRMSHSSVLCPREEHFLYADEEKYEVLRVPAMPVPAIAHAVPMPFFSLRIRHHLNENRFDVYHAHSPFNMGRAAVRFGRRHNIPVVATFHSKYYDDALNITHSKLIAKLISKKVVRFYKSVDEVWACSAGTADTLRSYGYKGEIRVMGNGVDLTYPDNADLLREKAVRQFSLETDKPVLLFVGQQIWQKNLALILDTCAELKQRNFSFNMYIAGTGYNAPAIQQYAREKKLGNCVRFLGEVDDRDLLMGLYLSADLFFFPSLYDNAPLVVREAAALRLPSLLSENTNAAEGIQDSINGFVCPPNIIQMADKIQYIFSLENLPDISENAKNTIPVSWDSIVENVQTEYVRLISAIPNNPKERIKRRRLKNKNLLDNPPVKKKVGKKNKKNHSEAVPDTVNIANTVVNPSFSEVTVNTRTQNAVSSASNDPETITDEFPPENISGLYLDENQAKENPEK